MRNGARNCSLREFSANDERVLSGGHNSVYTYERETRRYSTMQTAHGLLSKGQRVFSIHVRAACGDGKRVREHAFGNIWKNPVPADFRSQTQRVTERLYTGVGASVGTALFGGGKKKLTDDK